MGFSRKAVYTQGMTVSRRVRHMATALQRLVAPKTISITDALTSAEILLRFIEEGRKPTREEFVAILRAQNHPSYKITEITDLLFD